jgi:hypothetical protein
MSNARLSGVFAVVLLLLVAINVPITALISPQRLNTTGLTISRIEGGWRQAVLSDVTWRGYEIGEVTIRPTLRELLNGRVLFEARTVGGSAQFDGFVGRSLFSSLLVKGAKVSAELAGLPVMVQLTGPLIAQIEVLEFGQKGCQRAVGTIETDALTRGIAGLPWAGPVLKGQLKCAEGALMLPLSSETKDVQVSAVMMLKPDGMFDARIDVVSPDASIAQILPQLGFRPEGNALVLIQSGRWSK